MSINTSEKLRSKLLAWYDQTGRTLPWRIRPVERASGKQINPYPVWLSEIMCQQTRIQTVIPYFQNFMSRWPTVAALAKASRDEVYQAWAGLGYYARARNLHDCARIVATAGTFPTCEADWLALPGIGPYTAAAIMAIVHDYPTNVVDGNVERVMARYFALSKPLPGAKADLRVLAASLVNNYRAGDYAQALMDLGALICTPKSPDCPTCPWQSGCVAHAKGNPTDFPYRTPKKPRSERYGVAFVLCDEKQVYLHKRPERGLLGGMMAVVGTPWTDEVWVKDHALTHAPCAGQWRETGEVRHVFTHFALNLRGLVLQRPARFHPVDGVWVGIDQLDEVALPSLYRKLLAVCL